MNNKLDTIRRKIDILDEQIIHLLDQRMNLISEVKKIKQENNLLILDRGRENEIRGKISAFKANGLWIRNIYGEIFKNSKFKQKEKLFGLLGKSLKHSFSKEMTEKFFALNKLEYAYLNLEFEECELDHFFKDVLPLFEFINVTIPYKEKVIPYLDFLDESVEICQACNLILVKNERYYGFNTDYLSLIQIFEKLKIDQKSCMILGTGGAGKACYKALSKFTEDITVVSRNKDDEEKKKFFKKVISYDEIEKGYLLIQATPVGTLMKNESILKDDVLQKFQIGFDLVYNPYHTLFLKSFKNRVYGLELLYLQNRKALEIYGFDPHSYQFLSYEEWRGVVSHE